MSTTTGYFVPANRTRTSRDAALIPYHWERGDALIQDKVLHPETVREVMATLAPVGGNLVYTPEMQARIMTVLQRRFETDIGNDIFVPPNYAPYEDPQLAAFYGIDTSETNNIQTREETFEEQKKRLVKETARELETELPGLAEMMEHYREEDWARHGIADETIYMHSDPDITLFRNPGRGWCTIDRPVATSQKRNVIDMTEGQPEFVFPRTHPAWEVDRKYGYWDSLS
jgi:hypothetical protein